MISEMTIRRKSKGDTVGEKEKKGKKKSGEVKRSRGSKK